MLKAYKYRIFPTEEQQVLLASIFGQTRFVYNLGLETKITAYAGNKTNIELPKLFGWTKLEIPKKGRWVEVRRKFNQVTALYIIFAQIQIYAKR